MSDEQAEMFSRQWYNEYFRRAATSAAHAQFCEKVYGKDLCQHGLMDMAELDFLITLIEPGSKILEIGCSNGRISEYIAERVECQILGLDYSDVAIEQAQEKMEGKGKALHFEWADLTNADIPGGNYDLVLSIDSIYFLGELEQSLPRLSHKLRPTGKMVVTYFQEEALSPEATFLALALEKLGFIYEWYDFSENARAHALKNYLVGEELKAAFYAEENGFLYLARAAENRAWKESADNKAMVRYMYVVRQAGIP